MKKSVKAYREKLLRRRGKLTDKVTTQPDFERTEKEDREAEQRKTKVVEPKKTKKRGRPKKK